jgi:dTDP-4-dehydrorhamnose reductase
MKILLLGHKGMLGHTVLRYLIKNKISVQTLNSKWPEEKFRSFISCSNADIIVNCIGAITQKNYQAKDFYLINYCLPIYLSQHFKGKLIQPTSDCEFVGKNCMEAPPYTKQCERDAKDDYGKSKGYCSEFILDQKNCHLIRTSIIGPELSGSNSLWEWLKNNKETCVTGYANHMWNGITTLRWAEVCLEIIKGHEKNKFIQLGTKPISKATLLEKLNSHLNLKKHISYTFNGEKVINKCLKSDYDLPNIDEQIKEFLNWK